MPDRFGNIPIEPHDSATKGTKHKRSLPLSSPPPKKRKSEEASQKSLWLWAILISSLLGCYCAFGFLGIPYYLTNLVPEQFQKKTGLTLETEGVKFNPFSFRLEAQGSRILESSGDNLASVRSVVVDLAPLSLLRQDLVCNTLDIDGLVLNITREVGNHYNIAQLYGQSQKRLPSEIMQFSDLPFFFSLNNIAISNSRILFTDIPTKRTHKIEDIRLDLPTFSNIPYQVNQYIHPQFSAIINGSPIELSGDAYTGETNGNRLATKLAFKVQGIAIPTYAEYFPFDLPFRLTNGKADGNIELYFDPRKTKEDTFYIGFELQVKDSEIENQDGSISISSPFSELSGTVQPASKKLWFSNVTVKNPSLRSFGKSFLQNGGQFFNTSTTSAQSPKADKPFSLQIDLAIVDNGTAMFFKSSESKKPHTSWNALQLSLKKYSSDSEKAKLNGSNSFRISGEKDNSLTSFSWQGRIHSANRMEGALQISHMKSSTIFTIFGTNTLPHTSGIGNFDGTVVLEKTDNKDATVTSQVVDASITINDFKLMAEKVAILSSSQFTTTDATFEGKELNLGNVQLQNATANLSYGQTPDLFARINNGTLSLRSLLFEGETNFFLDSQKVPAIILTELTIKANSLSTSSQGNSNISISSKTKTGGTYVGTGKVALSPFALTLESGFNTLPLQALSSLFSNTDFSKSLQGTVAGKGALSLPKLKFKGELQIHNGSALDTADTPISWKNVDLENVTLQGAPFRLDTSLLDIDHLVFPWKLTASDNDPMQQIAEFIRTIPEEASKGTGDSEIHIDKITWKNSSVEITDTRLQPQWKTVFTNLQGELHNLHSSIPLEKSIFAFTGKVGETSVNSSGNGRFFATEPNGTITFVVKNGSLPLFNKQLQPLSELDTSNGTYDLQLNSKWREGMFYNTGTLILKDIEPVSSKNDSALALALMSDSDGTITLPYSISRDRPIGQNPLFHELLTQFQRRIIKSSVSPMLLAGNDYTDLIDNDMIECIPGKTEFSEQGSALLNRYSELLKTHPKVALTVVGQFDLKKDVEALQTALTKLEKSDVAAENVKNRKEWEQKKEQYEQLVEKELASQKNGSAFVEGDIPVDVLVGFIPKQPSAVVLDQKELKRLAEERARFLRQHLITEFNLEADRIIIDLVTKENQTEGSTGHGVKIKLSVAEIQ